MSKQDELFLKELLANAGVFRSYSDDDHCLFTMSFGDISVQTDVISN
ncbi:hypothetical protein N9L24_00475 [Candidatus Marinamargulisbacteria bacterium]|jgi:hypothetical protein|nr:hypothetical protein [Candidatus Marinamargulisbacteria bacterium]